MPRRTRCTPPSTPQATVIPSQTIYLMPEGLTIPWAQCIRSSTSRSAGNQWRGLRPVLDSQVDEERYDQHQRNEDDYAHKCSKRAFLPRMLLLYEVLLVADVFVAGP